MTQPARHGLGDPRIPWIVLLDVPGTLAEVPDGAEVIHGDRRELLGALGADGSATLRVDIHDDGALIAARHDALDGLAMLAFAGLRSTARGIDPDRPTDRGAPVRRLWEIAVRPPARVAHSVLDQDGDSYAEITIAATPRTAELVVAGARAVDAWNLDRGRRARRISVAVGVSTVGGDVADLADRSAFLRLTGVERHTLDEVRHALAVAPVQPGGGGTRFSGAAGLVLRLAAPRLGSTLLVSHLGTIVDDLARPPAFYPVTGGGSGLSLGAASTRGRTTLTLRARASQHRDEDLTRLLDLVAQALDQAR